MATANIKYLFLALRPKTLTAAIVPVIAATALAYSTENLWNPWVVAWALISSMFIQIGTNFINDWADFKKGADTAERIGPQRATQSGWIKEKNVFLLGMASFLLAVLTGLPLVFIGGWPIVILGLVSLFCGYIYTGGPRPLAYHGLGDIFVILFFGIVAVMGTFYLHTGRLTLNSLWLGIQIGCLATVLIAINNLRDMNQDRVANKRTLAVRFGQKFAKIEITTLLVLPFLMNALYISWSVFLIPLLALPLVSTLIRDVNYFEPSPMYNDFLAKAAIVHMIFGLLFSVAIVF